MRGDIEGEELVGSIRGAHSEAENRHDTEEEEKNGGDQRRAEEAAKTGLVAGGQRFPQADTKPAEPGGDNDAPYDEVDLRRGRRVCVCEFLLIKGRKQQ